MKDFEELMKEATQETTIQRQRLRLRDRKIKREVSNGKQTNLQEFN